jgi:hypothetical protein
MYTHTKDLKKLTRIQDHAPPVAALITICAAKYKDRWQLFIPSRASIVIFNRGFHRILTTSGAVHGEDFIGLHGRRRRAVGWRRRRRHPDRRGSRTN